MLFCARYHFIPFEWLRRGKLPRNSTRSKPDIRPWTNFPNLAINCCMAFLSLVTRWNLDTPITYTFGGTPTLFAACRYAGQGGNLQRGVILLGRLRKKPGSGGG